MKATLKLEEAIMFAFSIYLFNDMDYSWWVYPALILTPDIGMIGYILNPKLGSYTYNLTHHKGIAIIVLLVGWYFTINWVELTGIILLGHSCMDRILGYGLKYPDHFKHTHLGFIK